MKNTYSLSEERVPEHILKVIAAIQEILAERAYDFILVGAAARDIVLDGLKGKGIRRATKDVDFAVYIPAWDNYTELITTLVASKRFDVTRIAHRLLFDEMFEVDIVPFGGIEDADGKYLWPPENLRLMTVIGFKEMKEESLEIVLPGTEIKFRVASLPGMCVLKLLAWKDRKFEMDRDGKDLGFIRYAVKPIHCEHGWDVRHKDINLVIKYIGAQFQAMLRRMSRQSSHPTKIHADANIA